MRVLTGSRPRRSAHLHSRKDVVELDTRVVGGMEAAFLALPAGALASSSGRPPNLTCKITPTTLFYSGTYNNVTVPRGQTCELSGATILGNVTVQTAGSVAFESPGTVGGNLFVGQLAGASEGTGWAISGAATANQAASMTFQGTVHGILANDGDLVINATTGDPAVAGDWFIGQLGGPPQEIGGSVFLTNNQVPIFILDNHIKRNLVCQGNNPPPINSAGGIGNTVDAKAQAARATSS
jgi:hypothetical protein